MTRRFDVERGLTFVGEDGLLGPLNGPQLGKVEPMGNVHDIYALRYATMSPPTPDLNYLVPDRHETAAQDLRCARAASSASRSLVK